MGMLSQDQIMPLLLEACPSFRSVWDSELDEDERKLVYVCLGRFARHLLDLKADRKTEEFAPVAVVIERVHTEGDVGASEAATIGLLEGVQNVWGNSGIAPDTFKQFLLPRSRLWWEQLELFWAGSIPYVGATMPNKTMEPTR